MKLKNLLLIYLIKNIIINLNILKNKLEKIINIFLNIS